MFFQRLCVYVCVVFVCVTQIVCVRVPVGSVFVCAYLIAGYNECIVYVVETAEQIIRTFSTPTPPSYSPHMSTTKLVRPTDRRTQTVWAAFYVRPSAHVRAFRF